MNPFGYYTDPYSKKNGLKTRQTGLMMMTTMRMVSNLLVGKEITPPL